MSSISDCIIKILADNGVSVEQKEIWGFAGKLENVIQLDFSEHDKVFEDKIAELKKDYKTVSGLLSDYQQENESLKQRIAELESKETKKTTKHTTVIVAKEINGQTYVTLDDFMSVVNDLQAKIGT